MNAVPSSSEQAIGQAALRISEVVDETGVSKELIHHYLREGLLPRPDSRALYSARHVRLLHQIKKLRDIHNMPLDVIRGVFEIFKFDPERLEPLTLAESLGKRLEDFGTIGDIISHHSLSVEAVAGEAGVPVERVADFVHAGIVSPSSEGGQERFSTYDANIISLCEHGVRLGIPFESFRTIYSYIRIAFELEYATFFDVGGLAGDDAGRVLSTLFTRREVVTSFFQNALQSLVHSRIHDLTGISAGRQRTLDGIVYRPSPEFAQRHRLSERIETTRNLLCEEPENPSHWLLQAKLLLHAGRYKEAVFFLDQAREKWPSNAELNVCCGRALILSGDHPRGRMRLASVRLQGGGFDSKCAAGLWLALSLFASGSADEKPEAQIRQGAEILKLVEKSLEEAENSDGAERVQARTLGGWLLTALPVTSRRMETGIQLLKDALAESQQLNQPSENLPGQSARLAINAAYLLFEALGRTEEDGTRVEAGKDFSRESLSALICRLDPACDFAKAVFLAASP